MSTPRLIIYSPAAHLFFQAAGQILDDVCRKELSTENIWKSLLVALGRIRSRGEPPKQDDHLVLTWRRETANELTKFGGIPQIVRWVLLAGGWFANKYLDCGDKCLWKYHREEQARIFRRQHNALEDLRCVIEDGFEGSQKETGLAFVRDLEKELRSQGFAQKKVANSGESAGGAYVERP